MGDERLIRRWFEELFNENDLDVADEILAADVQHHGPESMSTRAPRSPDDVKKYVRLYHRAFPDITYEIEDVFSDGEQYCVRWRAEGTHDEKLFGIEGSGEEFEGEGLNLFVIEDGEITEIWSYWDTLGMVQELNLVSPLGLAAAGDT